MSDGCVEQNNWTLEELAEHVGGIFVGNRAKTVGHVADLRKASEDAISHCSVENQVQFLEHTQAGIVILRDEYAAKFKGDCIIADNPRIAFAQVVKLLHVDSSTMPGTHDSAVLGRDCVIDESVKIGANSTLGEGVELSKNVSIGAGCVLGNQVFIDEETSIDSNVSIYRNCKIGRNCLISAGVVIGASGFSFEWDDKKWVGIPNIGRVIIGDNVDIGACTSIDRGSIEDTCIGNGVKIDNNVQIAHNVTIGEHSIIAGNVGIAGSVKIGKRCKLGGQTGVCEHVTLADDTVILANSLVTKSLKGSGTYSSGIPVSKASKWRRAVIRLKRL